MQEAAVHEAAMTANDMTMNDRPETPQGAAPESEAAAPEKDLPPAARRALAEAAERRRKIDRRAAEIARIKEHQGRGGLEPVRYEDWEIKGLASDF